jgi:FG-GAP-like repeat
VLEAVDRDGDGRDELVRALPFDRLELYDPALPGPALLAVPITEGIYDLQAADFDADGKEDFLVCGKVSGTVPIRFTTGSWFAQPPVQTSASGELAGIVALGQIDGSGAPDLVALHPSSGLLTWCVGNGDGTFQAPNPIGSVLQAYTVRLFDLDDDGRLDVHVQTGQAGGTLFSFLQPGGTFAPTPLVIGCDTGYAIADIDLDGVDDLVTRGGWLLSQLVVRRGSGGAAGFAPIPNEVSFSSGLSAGWRVVAAHDYDGDGRQDLLLQGGEIAVMFHRSYVTPGTQPFGTGSAGCSGPNGWAALTQPVVGNAKFALRGDAAPANGVGLALLSAQADVAGSDPLQLGPLFHVGLGGVFFAGVKANSAGSATIGLPVPNDPTLVGIQLFTQVVWSWSSGPCVPTQPLGLSSSPGLTLTIQP